MSVLLPIQVVTLVAATISPSLRPVAVLLVVTPLAQVAGAVRVLVKTISIGLVILPITLVHVTIGVPKLALAVGSIPLPLTFVSSPVGPHLGAPSALHTISRHISVVGGLGVGRLKLVGHDQILIEHELFQTPHLRICLELVRLSLLILGWCR